MTSLHLNRDLTVAIKINYHSLYLIIRQKRMAEILAAQSKAKYGSVKEISAVDYVDEVNKAGDGVWVVLHLYKTGYPFMISTIRPVYKTGYTLSAILSFSFLHDET